MHDLHMLVNYKLHFQSNIQLTGQSAKQYLQDKGKHCCCL